MSKKAIYLFVGCLIVGCTTLKSKSVAESMLGGTPDAPSATVKPKYGPEITRLSKSHTYVQKNAALDYWALSPYYLAQQDGKSCSLASVTMMVNAARVEKNLTADDEIATQANLLKRVNDDFWFAALGVNGHGVSLDKLKPLVEKSLKAYGVEHFTVKAVHTTDLTDATQKQLHKDLVENEKSAHNFIIANFNQGIYTGDADAGHIAPVGAYDAITKQVLVMDPDRDWYEPYWVSELTFLKGMATPDKSSGLNRGYIFVSIQK